MKFLILACVSAVALAAPQQVDDRDRFATITLDERVDNGDGSFSYAFASDNGIEAQVAGSPGQEGQSNMQGFYLLPRGDGSFARVEFVANEGGFQPQSDLIPTPHPIPEHVYELLRIAEEQRAQGITFNK